MSGGWLRRGGNAPSRRVRLSSRTSTGHELGRCQTLRASSWATDRVAIVRLVPIERDGRLVSPAPATLSRGRVRPKPLPLRSKGDSSPHQGDG